MQRRRTRNPAHIQTQSSAPGARRLLALAAEVQKGRFTAEVVEDDGYSQAIDITPASGRGASYTLLRWGECSEGFGGCRAG